MVIKNTLAHIVVLLQINQFFFGNRRQSGCCFCKRKCTKNSSELLKEFQVIHICGKGKTDESIQLTGYVQYEYVREQLPDMFALADIVISRAGANAICELAALSKPNLLIPLSAKASRGDQILNARSFERQGYSMVLEEEKDYRIVSLGGNPQTLSGT